MPRRATATADAPDYDELPDYEPPERDAPKPLTQREASKLQDSLADLIVDAGEWTDKGLTWLSVTRAECDVWQVSDKEADSLARMWVERGKKSALVAESIRRTLNYWDVIAVGVMLFGRVVMTGDYVRENGIRAVSVPSVFRRRNKRAPATAQPAPSAPAGAVATSGVAEVREPAAAASPTSPSGKRRVPLSVTDANQLAEARQRANAARVTAQRQPLTYAAPAELGGSTPDDAIARIVAEAEQAQYGDIAE